MAAMNLFERLRGWKLRDWVYRMSYEFEQQLFPVPEIQETAIDRLSVPDQRGQFQAAHERLLEKATGTHLSLSIVGGAPDPAAWAALLELPYASLAVDLIAGPDNWNLVTRLAGDRGVVAGVIEPVAGSDDRPELPVWAAHYAASTGGRGLARVGLATAGDLSALSWSAAATKLR